MNTNELLSAEPSTAGSGQSAESAKRAGGAEPPAPLPEKLPAGSRRSQDNGRSATVATRATTLNPTCFLNRVAVKNFLLEYTAAKRAHKFNRVSQETLVKLNEIVRSAMIGHVQHLPSKGKTI